MLLLKRSSTECRFEAFLTVCIALMWTGCDHSTPAAASQPRPSASVASPSVSLSPPVQSAASATSPTASSSAPVASASASTSEADPLASAPDMLDPEGKPLGQTEAKPLVQSPAFQKRVQLLWSAIVAGDPPIADASFFPVVAYEQVKDIKSPASDWKSRLLKNFARDIREYHKKLGAEPEALRFLGIEVDEPRVKWMDRGKEGNKLGYYRVTRSKLRYADPAGKEHTLELSSLISWRGEWFVVHLHGFK